MLVALILIIPISLAVYTVAQQSDMLIDWMAESKCRTGSHACPSPLKVLSSGGALNLSDPKAVAASRIRNAIAKLCSHSIAGGRRYNN